MKAILAGGLYLPPGSSLTDAHQRLLRKRNPAHIQWTARQQFNQRIPEPPMFVEGWRIIPGDHPYMGGVALPRHGLQVAAIFDRTTLPAADALQLQVQLRDYQKAALRAWEASGRSGVVIAPCGAGKTTLGLAAVASCPTSALILCHTNDLVVQWRDRVQQQLGLTATLVGGGKAGEPARVTIATFQTLARWPWWIRHEWAKNFGLVIVDEAHHAPANTFAEVLLSLPPRHRLGLTATPTRPDGLTDLLWWHLGPACYEVSQSGLVETGDVMPPEIERFNLDLIPQPRMDWGRMLTQLSVDEDRNDALLARAHRLLHDGRQLLILSERVEHCEFLAAQLAAAGWAASALHGGMSKKDRARVLLEASEGRIRCVTATTVADEGLDLPGLDALLLATPCSPRATGRLQQRVGRICRPRAGKRQPLVVDAVDPGLEPLFKKRMKLYEKLGANT